MASRSFSAFRASTPSSSIAAIGAKLGQPARPAVCLIGDGGLQFSLPELASAVEAQLPPAVVIWNNKGYGEIKSYMRDRQIPEIGVDIYTPDFIAIAKGLGCAASRPADIAVLRDELARSARRKMPTVIEIRSSDPLAREQAE